MSTGYLDFETYQREALTTDQVKDDGEAALLLPLLGLVGEIGTLATEQKKRIRDNEKHQLFADRIAEDLGDILWYLSNFASKSGMSLEEIARRNLAKVRARWSLPTESAALFDEHSVPHEQLPRRIDLDFCPDRDGHGIVLHSDGRRVGDRLTDNNRRDDGYRFHDVFHLAYAATLGWSPVTRALLNCKRRSSALVDEVEDGGRAIAIEEGIAALVYADAKNHAFYSGLNEVDHAVLDTIRRMTSHLEVATRTEAEWQRAILVGFEAWRLLRQHRGGRISVDLVSHSVKFTPLERRSFMKSRRPRRTRRARPRAVAWKASHSATGG
jgi:NTP pyrophosphatase (non-canonical NTP hydrolase)